jgi:hypothetical protein
MLCTTLLLTLSIVFVKGIPWPFAISFLVFFGFIDGAFRPSASAPPRPPLRVRPSGGLPSTR